MDDKKPYIIDGKRVSLEEYRKTKYEDLRIRVPKGKKQVISDIAKSQGESINRYVKKAVRGQIKADTGQDVEL
jgi:predicted HicB family RNase H-like nuclease